MSMPPYPDLTGKTVPRKIEELENAYIKLSRFVDDALKTVDARNFTQTFYKTWSDAEGNITTLQGDVEGISADVTTLNGTVYDSAYYRFKSDGLHIYSGGLNIWDGTPDSPGNKNFYADENGNLILENGKLTGANTEIAISTPLGGVFAGNIDYPSGTEYSVDFVGQQISLWAKGSVYSSNIQLQADDGNISLMADDDITLTAGGHINIGTVLYNNASGTASTITLSSSAANFNYLEIFYRDNVSVYSFVKVAAPNGKYVSLGLAEIRDNDEKYEKNARIYINGTSITFSFNNEAHTTASAFDSYAMSAISITKIIGH